MKGLFCLTKRNVKVFFKDKGTFFTSLITPIILLVLYVTFLADVYKDSFYASLKSAGVTISDKIVNATVSGQLMASLLSVSCVTVAFCSNTLMVNDKVSGVEKDLLVTPTKRSVVAVSYFISSLISTLIVTLGATAACLVYISFKGWCYTFSDVLLIILDVVLLTAFGVSFASVINSFLKTSGQVQGIGTIVSAGYGFICGAYMPVASFGKGLQRILGFLPGNYGTAVIKTHAISGATRKMAEAGFPSEVIENIKNGLDCSVNFWDRQVSLGASYIVLIASTLLLAGIYVIITASKYKKK